ncbi:MAG: hypothetical protein AAFV53_11685 [Myxococcota bacterium]
MSRPPRPPPENPTAGTLTVQDGVLDYLPLEHADFLRLQLHLAAAELGSAPPEGSGDFARTLFDLAASTAHVLALYQDLYAGEAFLPSARSAESLTRHARRLAYSPDGGRSASGYVVLTVKEAVSGRVDAGLKLTSSPLGEARSETFESTAAATVSGAWNAISPAQSTLPIPLAPEATALQLRGRGHRLSAGDLVALVGPGQWSGFRITAVTEEQTTTTVHLDRARGGTADLPLTPWDAERTAPGHRLLVDPGRTLRSFGWNADPALFSPAQIRSATAEPDGGFPTLNSTPRFGWRVHEGDDGTNRYNDQDLYLSTAETDPVGDGWLLRWGSRPEVFRVPASTEATTFETTATVSLVRAWEASVFVGMEQDGTDWVARYSDEAQERLLSATVTRLTLQTDTGMGVDRTSHPLGATFHGGWRRQIPLLTETPNTAPIASGEPLAVLGDLTGMTPGHLLALQTRDGAVSQIVMLADITFPEAQADPTTISWRDVTALPEGHVWVLGDLLIRGNVAAISHGETIEEVLGGSDGVTPFQTFSLQRGPLTRLSTGRRIAPVLTVRVNAVAWQRVETFHDSGPDSRHFMLEVDADQQAMVRFGDGLRGAVPPAGRRNVSAIYRIGIGAVGNVSAGRIHRIARSHPLLEGAVNPIETTGGSDPAGAEGIRTQATRYIRTFDRAVSVQDYADLALLWPGITAATSRWDPVLGVVLIVAQQDGAALAATDREDFRVWLDARRDTAQPLTLRDPVSVQVHLGISVEYDPDWLSHAVDEDIHDALWGERGRFSFAPHSLGQGAHLSEVYALLGELAGVRYVEITHFALSEINASGNPTVHDSLQVGPEQWLSMSEGNLTTTPPTDRTT